MVGVFFLHARCACKNIKEAIFISHIKGGLKLMVFSTNHRERICLASRGVLFPNKVQINKAFFHYHLITY